MLNRNLLIVIKAKSLPQSFIDPHNFDDRFDAYVSVKLNSLSYLNHSKRVT